MVHAFVLHTLSPRPGDGAGPCRLLYCRVFGSERPGLQELERERLAQKERVLVVARQVDTMYKLQQQVSGRPAADIVLQLPDEPVSLQDAPTGLFCLPAGDPFGDRKTVLWLGVLSLGFVLVCDPHENLMLAESTLRLLARYLLDRLRLLGPGSDVVLKADKTEVILNKVLPHGQLLFLNDQFMQALERELSATLPK